MNCLYYNTRILKDMGSDISSTHRAWRSAKRSLNIKTYRAPDGPALHAITELVLSQAARASDDDVIVPPPSPRMLLQKGVCGLFKLRGIPFPGGTADGPMLRTGRSSMSHLHRAVGIGVLRLVQASNS